jgi:hypothetical protein
MTAQGGLPTFLLEALNGRIAPNQERAISLSKCVLVAPLPAVMWLPTLAKAFANIPLVSPGFA